MARCVHEFATLVIEYGFLKDLVTSPQNSDKHARALTLLEQGKARGRIADYTVHERAGIQPESDRDRAQLEEVKQYSLHYQVSLKKAFGSQTYHFGYFPGQHLFVREDGRLVGVFPCVLETG